MEIDEVLRKIGISGARWIEENIDEQYKALSFLCEDFNDEETFLKLVVMNSVVSYQLSGKGEDWWWEFARYFSEEPPSSLLEDYITFLRSSKNNRRFHEPKIKRIQRLRRFLETADLLPYHSRMIELWNKIAQTLGSPPSSKTVVFAVKMYGYAARIVTGKFLPFPSEIPIPVDLRIERLTKKLGGADPIQFWNEVALKSGVPPLHIDSVVWPLLGDPELRKTYEKRFGETGKELAELIL